MSDPIHVIFDLPSGSRADVTFHNRADAKYLYDAMAGYAKLCKMPAPRMVTYMEQQLDPWKVSS